MYWGDSESFRVQLRCVESIAEIFEEGCAFPAKAGLDVGIGHFGSVEKVCCGYSDGMT